MTSSPEPEWLVLVYRVPSEPTRLRATVWRRLRTLGAVYLQNAVAVMPNTLSAERALRKLQHEIQGMNGSATLLAGSALTNSSDIAALFHSARNAEYDEILDKCRDFHDGLEKEYRAEHFTFGELEENEVELHKLKGWFEKVRGRDPFGASLQASTIEALEQAGRELEAYAAKVYETVGDEA